MRISKKEHTITFVSYLKIIIVSFAAASWTPVSSTIETFFRPDIIARDWRSNNKRIVRAQSNDPISPSGSSISWEHHQIASRCKYSVSKSMRDSILILTREIDPRNFSCLSSTIFAFQIIKIKYKLCFSKTRAPLVQLHFFPFSQSTTWAVILTCDLNSCLSSVSSK